MDKTASKILYENKKGIEDFDMSEPQFLIDVMNRHLNWCVIICLIGGGQEINTGEAGLEEWILTLKSHYKDWKIHYSDVITKDNNYIQQNELNGWLKNNARSYKYLHLAVSIRSFRSEKLSNFIHELLEINKESAKSIYVELKSDYPIVLARNLNTAKNWIKTKAKGSERFGIIASSGARRLRSYGIDVKNEIEPANWFLNNKEDVRSSYYMEDIATEFDIQGLEIDWACVAWGANFHIENNNWSYQKFKGTQWQNINKTIDKSYLKNTYRVLLTRARQGMVIFVPPACNEDKTRLNKFYDHTFNYLKDLGLKELEESEE